jgi:hypothetical protein
VAYSSAKPIKKPVCVHANSTDSLEIDEKNLNPIGYENSLSIEDLDEEMDLTTVSYSAMKKHKKAKTTPLPQQERSHSPIEKSFEQSETSNCYDVPKNLSSLVPKKSSKSLTGIGDFIPSHEVYRRLLEQLDLVMRMLPPELVK